MDKPLKETLTIEFKSDRRPLPMDEIYRELASMAKAGTIEKQGKEVRKERFDVEYEDYKIFEID